MAGALLGFFLQATWSEARGTPNYQGVAGMIGLGGAAAAALSFALVASHFTVSAARASDVPELRVMSAEDFPTDPTEADRKSAEYVRKFPDDPRAHFFRAIFFMRTMDMTSAQSEIRTALDEKKVLEALPLSFKSTLQIMLAATLVQQGRVEDARREAAPACASGEVMSALDDVMSELKEQGICPKGG
jgi:rhomboid protease GluP